VAAALLTEAPTAVAAVLHSITGKGASELSIALVAVEGKVGWDPNWRSSRLVGGRRDDGG